MAKNLLINENVAMTIIQGDGFEVTVVRSPRRRTLSLQIKDGEAIVRMPKRAPLSYAETFIRNKTGWIQQKLAASPLLIERQFESGEMFLFLGQSLELRLHPAQPHDRVEQHADYLMLCQRCSVIDVAKTQRQITHWYQQQAQPYLLSRTEQLAEKTGLVPSGVVIKTYRARWGSCKHNGEIQLNWKLIMAPPTIIDYVIIHELCHLQQHNHSPAFWQLVHQHDAQFKQHRSWLKTHGHQLTL